MKNVILRFAGGCLCFLATAAHAQRADSDAVLISLNKPISIVGIASSRPTADYLNNISTRAVRDFNNSYKDAVDTRWFVLKDGYSASCTLNNLHASVVYDRRGNWVYTIQYEKEANLPSDVRHIVKSTYYDYSITQVEKITHRGLQPIYWVHLQDATTLKIVRVSEGVMEVVEDYLRSK